MQFPTSSHAGRKTALMTVFGESLSPAHVVVIFMSLAMTLTAWQYSKWQSEKRIEQRFATSRDRVVAQIEDRMARYEDALWAGVSTIGALGGDVTLDQWTVFSNNLRIEERYPGINGIGVIHMVQPDDIAAYVTQRQAERPDFSIFPAHDEDIHLPIAFVEPAAQNAAAIGLDVAHEANRRTAFLAARDTGLAQISGPITLVQDETATPGFLFYAPFKGAALNGNPDGSAAAVYAPFIVQELLHGILAQNLRSVSLSISDAGKTIYDEHTPEEGLHDPNPIFADQVELALYGRQWTIDIRSNLAFRTSNTYVQPFMILIGGLIIEALIISLLILMAKSTSKAVNLAKRMTKELRIEQDKLVKSNQELEQFAYATTHDLKTPIRGIGGLAEMLREDLDDYLRSPNANPEVALGLDLIEDRVKRMTDLTSGILEFSRVVKDPTGGAPLDLKELVKSLTADFSLNPDQLKLDSDTRSVTVDPINCRRVLENLIGNAVKYHTNPAELCITLRCRDLAESLELTVSDNGPGIAPQYHKKIFGMFQTLRLGDAPESTGIGLAIVQKAVEFHNGTIEIQSEVGAGATFRFQWPKPQTNSDLFETAA